MPEKRVNYELGIQVFSKNRGSNYRVAGFKRDIRDLIIFYTDLDTMPAYYTIDFYTGYKFSKNCKAVLDFRNIANQQYFDIVGYNSKRFNMMVGISLTF